MKQSDHHLHLDWLPRYRLGNWRRSFCCHCYRLGSFLQGFAKFDIHFAFCNHHQMPVMTWKDQHISSLIAHWQIASTLRCLQWCLKHSTALQYHHSLPFSSLYCTLMFLLIHRIYWNLWCFQSNQNRMFRGFWQGFHLLILMRDGLLTYLVLMNCLEYICRHPWLYFK